MRILEYNNTEHENHNPENTINSNINNCDKKNRNTVFNLNQEEMKTKLLKKIFIAVLSILLLSGITNADANILIPAEAWDFTPNNGDELAIYDTQNNIVGSGVYNGFHLSIAIWENDINIAAKNGMNNNEQFSISYWNSITNTVSPMNFTWLVGDYYYSRDGISIASIIENGNKTTDNKNCIISDFKLAPNPTQNKFYITANTKTNCNINITIIDNIGSIVKTLSKELIQGFNRITIPCNNLPSGSYRVMITNENEKHIEKLIII